VAGQIHELRREIEREFGVTSRIVAAALGPIMLWSSKREEERLLAGHAYEPPTFIERTNWPAKPPQKFEPESARIVEPVTA